ncbi:MAG: hypothetical protein R3E31_22680 [Chloroflexota bacterium]
MPGTATAVLIPMSFSSVAFTTWSTTASTQTTTSCKSGWQHRPMALTGRGTATEPVLPVGAPGSWDEYRLADPQIIFNGATFEMWYSAFDYGDNRLIGYATSPDGFTWTKFGPPVFGGGDPGAWDEGHVGNQAIYFDGAGYHMWYTSNSQIGYATSPDGITWTRYANNPVLLPGAGTQWGDHPVFFDYGSDGAVLDGFSVTGGDACQEGGGGGVLIKSADVTIASSYIHHNNAAGACGGGGVEVNGGGVGDDSGQ